MKKYLLAVLTAATGTLLMLPASAQQAGFTPGYVGSPGYPAPPAYGAPQGYGQAAPGYAPAMGATPGFVQPAAGAAGSADPYYQPNMQAQTQGFDATEGNALSPYEQQELALKESRMLQELDDMKRRREMDESYRNADQSSPADFQQGVAAREHGSGRLRKAMGKMGTALRSTAQIAAPAGMAVGSIFLMKAVLGSSGYMPMTNAFGQTVMVPVQGR